MVPAVIAYDGYTCEGSNAFRVVMYCRTEFFINIMRDHMMDFPLKHKLITFLSMGS